MCVGAWVSESLRRQGLTLRTKLRRGMQLRVPPEGIRLELGPPGADASGGGGGAESAAAAAVRRRHGTEEVLRGMGFLGGACLPVGVGVMGD
jgi:hypothetical protein